MFKKALLLGIISGALAGLASFIYQSKVYMEATAADFSGIVKPATIFGASIAGGILAAIGFTLLTKWLKGKGEIVFNLLFAILSFASILLPIGYTLPLDAEAPELFYGLAIPMHFFPALGWFTLKPLFFPSKQD